MNGFRPGITIGLFLAFLTGAEGPAPDAAADPLIEAYVQRWHEVGRFNGAILVAQGDEVLFQGGFGLASREWEIPNTPETRFDIGSISKQFTTVMVLQLVAEGRLGLEDPLTRHLPSYRADTGDRVTIDHLLRQTSGLPCYVRDWMPTPEEREEGRPRLIRQHFSPEHLVSAYMSGDLLYEPGERYRYSNTNHFLLGRIIEEVTGLSFEENLKARLLVPLGLRDTGLLHPSRVIPRLATGYARIPVGEERGQYYYHPALYGTGGMYSTVRDLLAWNRAMESGTLLPKHLNALLFTPYARGDDGSQNAYAVNQFSMRFQGAEEPILYTGFSGAIDGFRADVFRFPETGHLVAILDNSEHYEHWRMAPGIVRILLGEEVEMPLPLASAEVAKVALNEGLEAGERRAREIRSEGHRWSSLELLSYDLDEYAARYLAVERGEEAIRLWQLGTALDPHSPDAWGRLGLGHEILGQDVKAREARERSEMLARRTVELLALLDAGDYEGLTERVEGMQAEAPGASIFAPSDVGPRFGRAFQSGELDKAKSIAKVWALGNPNTVGPFFSLANVFKATGETDRATEAYHRILEIEPRGPAATRARQELERLGG